MGSLKYDDTRIYICKVIGNHDADGGAFCENAERKGNRVFDECFEQNGIGLNQNTHLWKSRDVEHCVEGGLSY